MIIIIIRTQASAIEPRNGWFESLNINAPKKKRQPHTNKSILQTVMNDFRQVKMAHMPAYILTWPFRPFRTMGFFYFLPFN